MTEFDNVIIRISGSLKKQDSLAEKLKNRRKKPKVPVVPQVGTKKPTDIGDRKIYPEPDR